MLPSSWISPTAHYTGHVWWRNGLSHPAFRSATGRLFFAALEPFNHISSLLGGATLEAMLLARHRVIDHLLSEAIESGEIGQVLEVAAGLSPRGLRFTRRFPELVYLEADLPQMAARKRQALAGAGSLSGRHKVATVDALADGGEGSVAALCQRHFDPGRGVAIVTEGLINYFDTEQVEGIWRRFAAALEPFAAGLYLSDVLTDEDIGEIRGGRAFRLVLNQLTRGGQHRYFAGAEAVRAALEEAGFADARVHRASDFTELGGMADFDRTGRVRVIEARRR